MGFDKVRPLNLHYSFCDVPSQYDEESLTALELCGRTARKMNETLEALGEVVKKQDNDIDEAVDFMKENIVDTTKSYLYELAEKGEIHILEEAHYNAIRKNITTIVNVKEYGAMGDGVTDDTQAFKAALEAGVNIYIPAGAYVVSDTLTINKYYHLYGEGSGATVINFVADSTSANTQYLFRVSALYAAKPLIENIGFVGGDNGFMLCSRDAWGGSVYLRDCSVKEFGRSTLWFESAFMPVIENCVFDSSSPITFTTYDGVFDENNFNNCVTFKNCLLVGTPEQTHPAIELNNVRVIKFDCCTFENVDTLIECKNRTRSVYLYECWFENVGALYSKDITSSAVVCTNPNLVNVTKFDANRGTMDIMKGAPYWLDVSGNDNTMTTLLNDASVIMRHQVVNKNDAQAEYFTPFEIRTNKARFYMPVNTMYTEKTFTDGQYMDNQYINLYSYLGRIPPCAVYYKVNLIFTYADGDHIAYCAELFRDKNGYTKIIRKGETFRSTWLTSAGNHDEINFEFDPEWGDGGSIRYSSAINRCVKVESMTQWNICGFGGY